MNSKCLFIVWLAFFTLAAGRPKNKILNLGSESEPETKIREKRKYEIPLLRQLEESGVGKKRETLREAPGEALGEAQGEEAAKGEPEGAVEEKEAAAEPEIPSVVGSRVKKQSPSNVCIKVGGCGKTACGPIVSARGPVVGDMRAMIHSGKPVVTLGDLHTAAMSELNDASSKIDRFSPVHGRTVDTIVTPVTLGTLGYGTPAGYSIQPPTADLANFFKPSAVPAMAVITAPHQPSPPLIHPMIMPHLLPHLMPHILPQIMSGFGSYLTPHRFEQTRYPEPVQNDYKPPVSNVYPQPSFSVSGDSTLLCQPYRNQRLEGPFDYIYKPDGAVDKSLNVTDGSKKSNDGIDYDDRRIQENLRKVNEIKEEISQLNRAAQRIVDQQERLTAMHQKSLWGNSGSQSSAQNTEHNVNVPYMGSGYYTHPGMPWGYSRSNILSYPRSQDDIEFFLNLLRAGKKMGLLSDVVQPSVLSTIGEVLKGGQEGGKAQKGVTQTDGVTQGDGGKAVGTVDKKTSK